MKSEALMNFIKVKKIIFFSAILILTGLYSIFFNAPEASALQIRVLDLSTSIDHTSAVANIDGDFLNTRVTTLAGVNLSLFDVLYVGEHPDPFELFSGREGDVAAAISAGTLGFIAENDSAWSNISNILDGTITKIDDVGPNSLTPAGAAHQIFSGVNFTDLGAEDAFSEIPVGVTTLVQDNASNTVMFTGTLGLGRYFVSGTELTENSLTGPGPSSSTDNLLAHNAIHFVAGTAAVPEPATFILLGGSLTALFYCGRRKQQTMS